ncbi:peptidoglycan recognition protein family protein [Consotaella salsifontis]|uniref:N-acetylmuramoyl-L-alanine amidase n=1 Tax=Consotaella salsifontis TaxID=1365950 RepID=A0A1T4MA56_9HYPH|nr:N-acetylmuramoyl-L-alanine amidase [Consotaella salsifontis]SJZ63920.1 N-acetylmuramoyl-L-alanine amidase [Consotaella salsifontis]
MTPDSPLASEVIASPNHDERRSGARLDTIILHYTGMANAAAAVEHLASPESKVSCHYVVHEDGHVLQMVPEARRAWHAGAGSWRGRGDVNSFSVGIEIVNPGHEYGYRPFPPKQIMAVAELCRDVSARHGISAESILAHSDTAPARKQDPGELFPWDALFREGVGHWAAPEPLGDGRHFGLGDRGQPVEAFQALLAAYGYEVEIDGNFGPATRLVTLAFQRHFRQSRVDGVADASTVTTLHRLLVALPNSPFASRA